MGSVRLRSAVPGDARDVERWFGRAGTAERLRPPFDPDYDRAGFRHVRTYEDGSLVEEVEWDEARSALGRVLAGASARRRVARVLAFRHRRAHDDLGRHLADRDRPRLRVAITGSSGLIGTELAAFLDGAAHDVVRVLRGELPPEGVDAVVHLAGEPIAGRRWGEDHKRRIRESRVDGTRRLCAHLAEHPVRVLVSASACGFYGDRGDEVLTERSAPGDGFLAEVAEAWEAATRPASEAGVRVVLLRTGVVYSAKGGALATMLPAYKAGAGGPMGGGRQFVPWIHLDDEIGIVHLALRDESLKGPLVAAAPAPATQRDVAATLGRVLGRPALLPAPAAALYAAFGREMATELLLSSQRAAPERVRAAGYRFLFPDLEEALRFELGRLLERAETATAAERAQHAPAK